MKKNPFSYLKNEMVKFRKPIVLALMGLFIALAVVFTRILRPIELPYLRVSFGFLATSLCSAILGPLLGAVNAMVGDIAGVFLFPTGQPFFPGFTISALISGVIYGLFLYKKPLSLWRVILAVLCVSVFVDLLLNTYWLTILLDKAWMSFFVVRAIRTAAMAPFEVFFIYITYKYAVMKIPSVRNL